MLVSHLLIISGDLFIQVLCPVLNQLFCCRSYLYILNINLLSNIWFPNIFSHPMGHLFSSLILYFDAQKFLILLKSKAFAKICFVFVDCSPSPFLSDSLLSFYIVKAVFQRKFRALKGNIFCHFKYPPYRTIW